MVGCGMKVSNISSTIAELFEASNIFEEHKLSEAAMTLEALDPLSPCWTFSVVK